MGGVFAKGKGTDSSRERERLVYIEKANGVGDGTFV